MKFPAKKSSLGLIVLLCTIGLLTFLACEKEILVPQGNTNVYPDFEAMFVGDVPDVAEFQAYPVPPPFDFKVVMTKCKTTQPRVSLRVVIDDENSADKILPERYKYLWTVNGVEVGKGPILDCFCARSATVTVSRMADHQNVTKTIWLWVCNAKEPSIYYEDK